MRLNKKRWNPGGAPLPLLRKKKNGLKFNPELAQEDSWLALIGLQTGPSCSNNGKRYLFSGFLLRPYPLDAFEQPGPGLYHTFSRASKNRTMAWLPSFFSQGSVLIYSEVLHFKGKGV